MMGCLCSCLELRTTYSRFPPSTNTSSIFTQSLSYFRKNIPMPARDSEWQWHQLGNMQVCTSLQTDNHASNPPLIFLQTGSPSWRPANSVKALKARCKWFVYVYVSETQCSYSSVECTKEPNIQLSWEILAIVVSVTAVIIIITKHQQTFKSMVKDLIIHRFLLFDLAQLLLSTYVGNYVLHSGQNVSRQVDMLFCLLHS